MPYYAYVNGKATIGLGTVEELNEYIKKSYGHYTRADVDVFDMTWTREGQQLMDSYYLVKGRRVLKKVSDYVDLYEEGKRKAKGKDDDVSGG